MRQNFKYSRDVVCLLLIGLCLALLTIATSLGWAQSGRRKEQPEASPNPSSTSTRSRRVAKNQTPQKREESAPDRIKDSEQTKPRATPTPNSAATATDEAEEGDVVRVNSNLVTVPATVIDAQGKAVADLSLKDFELRIDGQLKPISEVERWETPVRIALLFDNSGSVTAAREVEIQAAVRFFNNVIRPIDQAAIYSVSTVSTLEQPLTSDIRTLVRTIERFGKPEGATALFDGIGKAAAYLHPHQGRKVIVIVSDGVDTVSYLDFETTLKRVLVSDCQIYVVQTGYTDNPNVRDLTAERRMQMFAAETGGAVYLPLSTNDLDRAFAQIAADLAQQYVLTYYASNDPHDGRFRTIGLRVATRTNVRVRARRGYYSPKG
jgi:Ca-activated chloride channel family protein